MKAFEYKEDVNEGVCDFVFNLPFTRTYNDIHILDFQNHVFTRLESITVMNPTMTSKRIY